MDTAAVGSRQLAVGTDDDGSWQMADGSWDGSRQLAVGMDGRNPGYCHGLPITNSRYRRPTANSLLPSLLPSAKCQLPNNNRIE
jgi:hypothetical protein